MSEKEDNNLNEEVIELHDELDEEAFQLSYVCMTKRSRIW